MTISEDNTYWIIVNDAGKNEYYLKSVYTQAQAIEYSSKKAIVKKSKENNSGNLYD